MNHELRMQLTRQLQIIRHAAEGANAQWLFFVGTIAEVLGGLALIDWAILWNIQAAADNRFYWVGYMILLLGMILIGQALYLTFNRFMNRRLRLLYEAILETPEGERH